MRRGCVLVCVFGQVTRVSDLIGYHLRRGSILIGRKVELLKANIEGREGPMVTKIGTIDHNTTTDICSFMMFMMFSS